MLKHLLTCTLAFLLTGTVAFADNAPASPVREIILVFKTHFDIGYTRLASEVVEHYRTDMIDQALGVVDAAENLPEEKKFIWTVPGWPMAKILENQTPERAARLNKAIREGRFAVHALPFTTHTETLVEEDLVRGLRFSTDIAKQYGFELPTDAKMTDVPCHSWFLPTLLAHSGITFMHEGTNSGSSDPDVPLLYFREGPDGSRVLTMHVDGYGSGIDPPKDWPYQTWLGLIHTGDNHGPPRAEEIENLFKQCAEKYPGVKVRIRRLSDFGDAILAKEDLSKIPVVRGDMPDTWIHGPMCDPQGQRMARAVHEQITSTEILGTLYNIYAKEPAGSFTLAKQIADAREQSLLYGEHTWGAALYWMCNYGAGETLPFGDAWQQLWESQNFTDKQKRMMKSWEEHTNYIRGAMAWILAKLSPHNPLQKYPMFFNPLSWEMTLESGEKLLPGQIVTLKQRQVIEWFAHAPVNEITRESPFFRVTVDGATGKIKSLYDRKNDRELIRQTDHEERLGLLYQRAGAAMCDQFMNDYCISFPDWVRSELGKQGVPKDIPERRIIPKRIKNHFFFTLDDGTTGIQINYDVDDDLPFSYSSLYISLSAHRPEVFLKFLGLNKQPDTWPEAGYFCFPLNIDSPQFRLGRLGGIVDPAKDIVPGSNRHLQWLRTGMAVFGEDGYGVGICPLDAPLVSLGEPGCWKFSKDYVPDKANVYFNLFNNQWTTNFRLWNQGDITASFVLWTFDKYDNESSLITPSLETLALNFPPSGQLLKQAESQLMFGVETSRKGISISSFGEDPDTGKMMLRMWEMAGLGKDDPAMTVTLPQEMNAKSVTPCDLRGRPIGEPIRVKDGAFQIDLKPYSPVNLLIE